MLSVFLCSSRGQLPVASCQLPVVSRQSYWSRASHRLSGLASTCTNMFAVVRNSRRIRDFWQYLARGYHVPRGQLINWRTKHLPCLSLTLSHLFHSAHCIYLPVIRMPKQSPQFQFKLSLWLWLHFYHIGYLRKSTHTLTGSMFSASFRPNSPVKKCHRRSASAAAVRILESGSAPFTAVSPDVSG